MRNVRVVLCFLKLCQPDLQFLFNWTEAYLRKCNVAVDDQLELAMAESIRLASAAQDADQVCAHIVRCARLYRWWMPPVSHIDVDRYNWSASVRTLTDTLQSIAT